MKADNVFYKTGKDEIAALCDRITAQDKSSLILYKKFKTQKWW